MTMMTQAMEAHLRMNIAQAFSATQMKFDRVLTPAVSQPMPTLTDTITFRIHTPSGEVREFTAAFTVTELSTVTAAPTLGFDH